MNSAIARQPRRQQLAAHRAISSFVAVLTLCAGPLTLDAQADDGVAGAWQPPATIAAAAEAAVAGSGTVVTAAVDARLKLKRCAAALGAEIARPVRSGQGVVAVSCVGPSAWRLFVPVRATSTVTTVVVKRARQPGDVLVADDLELAVQPATTLPHDYVSDVTQVVGLALRRTQPAGAVLTLSALEYPEVVERGALVTLVAERGGISVKTEGVALEPGRLRQRVRVRSASGRVIEGTAEAPGLVRVGL